MLSGCPYKNIFGAPNTGVHAYRIFDLAIVDILMTLLGAWLLARFFQVRFWVMAIGLFALGIALHRFFCVETTVDKFLFGT